MTLSIQYMSASGTQNSYSVRRYSDGSWEQLTMPGVGSHDVVNIPASAFNICIHWWASMGLNMFSSTVRTVIIFIWTFPYPHLSISLSCAVTAQETFIDKYSYCSCVYLLGHHYCNLLVIFLRQAASQFMNWYQRYNYFIYFRVCLQSSFYSNVLFVPFNYSPKCLQRV